MELADVTDSKSVGSNTVRVRPPPSAPKKAGICPNRHIPAFLVLGGRTRTVRVVHGCTIVLAPSFARCETNRASTIRQPRHTFARSLAGCYFWCGGRENPHFAGRAWMHDGGRTESAHGRAGPNDRKGTDAL